MKQRYMAAMLWLVPTIAFAVEAVPVQVRASDVDRTNRFMQQVFALHQELTRAREIRTETETGGYRRQPDFYTEVRYYDAKTGRLLSKIQWEQAHPDRIHAIEVYVYGDGGRVVRDYSGWYLPYARNAPRETWITFHAYHDGLHGLRQFDALDNRVFESCQGTFRGEAVDLNLDELDIARSPRQPDSVVNTAVYKACFDGLPVTSAGRYLSPQ